MIIVFEGVVGAGKTTLAEKVSKKLNVPIYYELQNDDTMNLLHKFYEDKLRWSFPLQINFLNERFRMIKEVSKQGFGILDRSIFGDKIFASMLNEDGFMTNEEYRTYSNLLDNMLEHTNKPDLLVYLDCNLETAMERISIRNREMEQSVEKRYWERLNFKYDEWYSTYTFSEKLSIDAKSYHPENSEQIELICNQILKKLKL